MDALREYAAVLWMAILLNWPFALALVAVPVLLGVRRLRRTRRSRFSRRRAALLGFSLGVPAGVLLALAAAGGSFEDFGYWLDALFWAVLAAAIAVYAGIVTYLLARSSR